MSKTHILLLFLIGITTLAQSQVATLTDSTLTVDIATNESIPKMSLTLDKNFLAAYDELKWKYPDAEKITFYIFIFAGPGDKYRIDLFKTDIDGATLGFEGSLWTVKIITSMYNAELKVFGTLEDRVSYTIPLIM